MNMKSLVLTTWKKTKVKCNPKYGLAWKFMTIVKNMLLKEKILNI